MNTDIRVAVLIQKDDKFLLGQEATPIIYGLWNWQQGKAENNESLEDAAVREVKEETGLEVSLVRKLTVINNPFAGTKETHVYLGEIIGGEFAYTEDEILDLRWFTKEEIFAMRSQLSGPWVIEVIETYL
jgi:8-oxo-dGTP pyrophosphatase MutT (NUDIX family)